MRHLFWGEESQPPCFLPSAQAPQHALHPDWLTASSSWSWFCWRNPPWLAKMLAGTQGLVAEPNDHHSWFVSPRRKCLCCYPHFASALGHGHPTQDHDHLQAILREIRKKQNQPVENYQFDGAQLKTTSQFWTLQRPSRAMKVKLCGTAHCSSRSRSPLRSL